MTKKMNIVFFVENLRKYIRWETQAFGRKTWNDDLK